MTLTNKQPPSDILLILFAAIMFFLCLHGCKPVPTIARTDTVSRTIIRDIVHDTTLYVSDSAGFRALLECDSLGQVRVKQVQDYYAGQFVKPSIIIKNNQVKVDCKIDSAAVFFSWKEHDTTQITRTSTTVVNHVNYLTGWQWFQVWGFRIYAGLTLLIIAYFGIKTYLKTKVL